MNHANIFFSAISNTMRRLLNAALVILFTTIDSFSKLFVVGAFFEQKIYSVLLMWVMCDKSLVTFSDFKVKKKSKKVSIQSMTFNWLFLDFSIDFLWLKLDFSVNKKSN